MIKVLVTGSAGFIGSHLVNALTRKSDVVFYQFDVDNSREDLLNALKDVDVIYHLAGVNRPPDVSEFAEVNTGLTGEICEYLREHNRTPKIILSSSIQAEIDNPYGASKKAAEDVLKKHHDATGSDVVVYRLPNAFGKWSRPNYNTVIATFCYNIANDLPIQISDESNRLQLVYIDDIIKAFLSQLDNMQERNEFRYEDVSPVLTITLGELVELLRSFKKSRETLLVPDLSDRLTEYLYATYLSFLPEDGFAYQLPIKEDDRGALAEFIKSPHIGQIFVSWTKPGITRGDHYHHSKVEKFLVLSGKGIIRFRQIHGEKILDYPIDGKEFKVVDIPPGYTHSIENVGDTDLVVLFWAGQIFNPDKPDTIWEKVLS